MRRLLYVFLLCALLAMPCTGTVTDKSWSDKPFLTLDETENVMINIMRNLEIVEYPVSELHNMMCAQAKSAVDDKIKKYEEVCCTQEDSEEIDMEAEYSIIHSISTFFSQADTKNISSGYRYNPLDPTDDELLLRCTFPEFY